MAEILRSLAVLACPVGMGLMMWLMMRGRAKQAASPVPGAPPPHAAAAAASSELARLRAEIDQLEAAQREAVRSGDTPKDLRR